MWFRRWIVGLSCLPALLFLGLVHLATGRTPAAAYQGMVRMFCLTGGWSNDMLSVLVGFFRRPVSLPAPIGVLGTLTPGRVEELAREIGERGFHVAEERLPAEMVERLVAFALATECRIRPMSGEGAGQTGLTRYDRGNPVAVRYDFDPGDVINNPDVQGLMADASLLSVAQAYLGSLPMADVTSMWWHTAYSGQPDEDAAQLFHFDMDRIRWLKIFIYLTDVTPQNGPHCFVAGSHRTGGIPAALLSKGYARLRDDEINRYFPTEAVVSFTAPAGTIILEDTRGLHKGTVVRSGDRLMLQLQFSNSMFGARYPARRFREPLATELATRVREHRPIYANYLS